MEREDVRSGDLEKASGTVETHLVSVVIPAYNAEAFLERTLLSALGQTYRNLEVLVVNDGSRDRTGEVADAMAAKNARVRVVHVENGGVARARNIGIEAASGEFVALLDADDLWHPTKVALQVAALEAADQLAAVYTLSRHIDVNDCVTHNPKPVPSNGFAFARHLYLRPVGNGSSMMVRRSCALSLGGYEPSWAAQGIGGCEDLDFELKVAAQYEIAGLPLYLVGYRYSPNNMSSDKVRMGRAAVATIAYHIDRFQRLPSWAERYAKAAVSAYALDNYLASQRWGLAAAEFIRLCRIDVARALRVSVWILKKEGFSLQRRRRRNDSEPGHGARFYDADPALDVDLSRRSRGKADQVIVRRLEELDCELASQRD